MNVLSEIRERFSPDEIIKWVQKTFPIQFSHDDKDFSIVIKNISDRDDSKGKRILVHIMNDQEQEGWCAFSVEEDKGRLVCTAIATYNSKTNDIVTAKDENKEYSHLPAPIPGLMRKAVLQIFDSDPRIIWRSSASRSEDADKLYERLEQQLSQRKDVQISTEPVFNLSKTNFRYVFEHVDRE